MLDLIGILLAFALLAILIYKKVEFGIAILVATGLLIAVVAPSVTGLRWLYSIITEYETLRLILIIVQIGYLGYIYKDSSQVGRMIKELKGAMPDRRAVLASIPAIFGLMPMPGGALVSAPMIDDEGDKLDLNSVDKTFMNWWFRHIWFTVYPLSVGLILASSLSGISLYKIALFNLPVFAVQVLIGIFWISRNIRSAPSKDNPVNPLMLIWELLPIILALSLNIILEIPLYFTLLLALVVLYFQNRNSYDMEETISLTKDGFSSNLLMASVGIMLFKGIIERANAIEPAVSQLQVYVPLVFLLVIVGVAVGLLFGHLPGAVGVGLPVMISMLPVVNVETVAFSFLFIFLGYLVSPIHLCIILTVEYFGAELKGFYKKMVLPFAVLVVSVVAWLAVNRVFFMLG